MASAHSQIRVVDLLPRGADEDFHAMVYCKKRTIDLADAATTDQYEALSYVWGSHTDLVPITVDGAELKVTRSVHAALCRLRLRDTARTLWIDQICIDQSDPKDKESQLPLMGRIYSSCSTCLIWLGKILLDKNVKKGISITDARAALDIIEYIASVGDENAVCPECLCGDDSESALKLDRAITALKAMSPRENPWWRRIWTVQEAALPKSAKLIWGPLMLPWDTLKQATSRLTSDFSQLAPDSVHERILRIEKAHNDVLLELVSALVWLRLPLMRKIPALFIFRSWRGRLASDRRDKVYGLLGLLPVQGSLPMTEACAYKKSVAEVFSCLTLDLILYGTHLQPLIMDPRLEPDLAAKNVPSWALDLSTLATYDTDWFHLYGYNQYQANDGLAELDSDALRESCTHSEGRTLKLKGLMIDVVQQVGQPMLVPKLGFHPERLDRDILQGWSSLLNNVPSHEPCDEQQKFALLLLGYWIRNENQFVERRATVEDVLNICKFLETGCIASDLLRTVFGMTRNQRFFKTEKGFLGLGHLDTKAGDEVWILRGGKVPFTLRTLEDQEGYASSTAALRYSFVGRCHVLGIMYGEGLKYAHSHGRVERFVELR